MGRVLGRVLVQVFEISTPLRNTCVYVLLVHQTEYDDETDLFHKLSFLVVRQTGGNLVARINAMSQVPSAYSTGSVREGNQGARGVSFEVLHSDNTSVEKSCSHFMRKT